MKYVINEELGIMIAALKVKVVRNAIYSIPVVLLFIIAPFLREGNMSWLLYFGSQFSFVAIVAYIYYNQIHPMAVIINQTVVEVEFSEHGLGVKTSGVTLLPFAKRLPKDFYFDKGAIKIKLVDYPLNTFTKKDHKIIHVTDFEKEVFIITEFFDDALQRDLLLVREGNLKFEK